MPETVPEPMPLPAADAEALRGLAGGAVHLPGDPLYDEARMPWNLQVDEHPAAVAYPADPHEVARIVRAAAAAGLRVAPQGTGHGAPPLAGRLGDAVLLRTSAMTGLRVDAASRTARAEAGVLWGDVVARAGRVGLAGQHMSSPGVGVVGSSLGGGVSWYSRQHGLQCSAITAVELVLADGTSVRATDDQDADLLWAARGGSGGFGVVTALEFDLLPVRTAYAGMLAWDWRHAQRVLTAWGEWTADAPESVTSVARIFQVPDIEWLPDQLRGRKMVMIDAVALGDAEAGARSIAPLRALKPEIDTFAQMPAPDIAHLQMDPQEPTAVYANSVLVDGFPAGRGRRARRGRRPGLGQQPALRGAAPAGRRARAALAPRRCARPPARRVPRARRRARRGHRVERRPRGRHADPGLARPLVLARVVPLDGLRGRRPARVRGSGVRPAGADPSSLWTRIACLWHRAPSADD